MERFNAESESDRSDEGHAKGYKPMFEYCEVSSAVLGGAREASDADEDGALRNAVVLKMLRWANSWMGRAALWNERIILPGKIDNVISSVEGMRPAARSAFDVYLDGHRLKPMA